MSSPRYEEAGVSIDAQDEAIGRIKSHVAQTHTPRVLSELGGFGGMFDIRFPNMSQPVLTASADGVGTKLKVAFEAGRHDTVGQCLVNHCINDILVQGAHPLFFMDYIATGKLRPGVVEDIVAGMAIACRLSGLAILGGEMAEMPGFYATGEYDVAGFIVGVVDRENILGAHRVTPGQTLIGLPSTGLHTNGYSLARKILFEERGLAMTDPLPGVNATVADALLAIHKPYYRPIEGLLERDLVRAMAHITGGGFLDNLPRVLPENVDAVIHLDRIEAPPLFRSLVEWGGLDREEAYRVFNMGIGMFLIVNREDEREALDHLRAAGEMPVVAGETATGSGRVLLKDR